MGWSPLTCMVGRTSPPPSEEGRKEEREKTVNFPLLFRSAHLNRVAYHEAKKRRMATGVKLHPVLRNNDVRNVDGRSPTLTEGVRIRRSGK